MGFLDTLWAFVVDGNSFTSFKFESKYTASLFLFRKNSHRHSYTSQSWLRSFSALNWNKDRQNFFWQLRKGLTMRYV